MDELIAAIIAGVVVTVVGAILAFYFGGVRERQRDKGKQQEEQNKRRAEALTEIKTLASVVVEDVRSWAENTAASLDVKKLPPTSVGAMQRGSRASLDRQSE